MNIRESDGGGFSGVGEGRAGRRSIGVLGAAGGVSGEDVSSGGGGGAGVGEMEGRCMILELSLIHI